MAPLPLASWRAAQLPIGLMALLMVPLAGGAVAGGAIAQQVIPKREGMCPLGYVDTFNGKCSTLGVTSYTVSPRDGEACQSGWMNIGGGYCRKK
ncbi:hypothetical protein [Synechococcus sp. MW101C3]|jgi:hypothetical protein|uniref:hypothetical protein n=2 Tax=Synechococcus TaxID=1129 RepID=UPI00350EC4CB